MPQTEGTDVSDLPATEQNRLAMACPGGWEAHVEHMHINGTCPWCQCYDPTRWDL